MAGQPGVITAGRNSVVKAAEYGDLVPVVFRKLRGRVEIEEDPAMALSAIETPSTLVVQVATMGGCLYRQAWKPAPRRLPSSWAFRRERAAGSMCAPRAVVSSAERRQLS